MRGLSGPGGLYPSEFAFRERGKKYRCTGEFRAPKKGEFYLSGAIITAYQAPNDFTSCYWIAKPVEMVTCKCCNGTGEVANG